MGLGSDVFEVADLRADSVVIGNHRLQGIICTLEPGTTLPPEAEQQNIVGTVGGGLLRRFVVVFDFPKGKLYLVPGPNYREKDEGDMSGIALGRYNDRVLVIRVSPDMPAHAAGLRELDKIIRVQDKAATELSLEEIRKILKSGDKKKISLRVRRGEKEFDVVLTLERAI